MLAAATVALPAGAEMFSLRRVATGLERPVFLTAAPGDPHHLYVLLQHRGEVVVIDRQSGDAANEPFLVVDGVTTGNEQGLLGMAFHPEYAVNGLFFVNYTGKHPEQTRIVRYRVSKTDALRADPESATAVMRIPQPQRNHNGGCLVFGPDGYLYVGMGDGGGWNDRHGNPGNGQNLEVLLGKLLRIDVNRRDRGQYGVPADNPFVGRSGLDEIWAYGLRNPWRCSFDRTTGDLYIGDVGQFDREEINVQPAKSAGGANYGWRLREGSIETPAWRQEDALPPEAVDPVYDFRHGKGPLEGKSVIGGYVYRGPVSQLHGHYFFADYVNQRLWSFVWDAEAGVREFIDWTERGELRLDEGKIGPISSFGEDLEGNLYILSLDGAIYEIVESSDQRGRDKLRLPAR